MRAGLLPRVSEQSMWFHMQDASENGRSAFNRPRMDMGCLDQTIGLGDTER